jgi:large subunit ribosomal protein L15
VKLSDLQPAPGSHQRERRLGRGHGSGRGKTAGRGTKGQKARTGGHVNRSFNGGQTRLSKRLPFVRGLGNNTSPYRDDYTIINIVDLEAFDNGAQVHPKDLLTRGLMTAAQSRGLIKILGDGELDHPLTVHAHKFSATAKAKIEAAGGSVEIIPTKVYAKTKRRKDGNVHTATPVEAQQ